MYAILTNHYFKVGEDFKQRLGYGVTDYLSEGDRSRVKGYSKSSGGEQEFFMLWYSPDFEVMAVEKLLKQRLSDDCFQIHGEDTEWISPYSDITPEVLVEMIEQCAKDLNKPIYRIKEEFLPFKDADWQDMLNKENIETYPERYLEVPAGKKIKITKPIEVEKTVNVKKNKTKKPDILRRKRG